MNRSNSLLLVGALALVLLLASDAAPKTETEAERVEREKKRIVDESREIVDGKRDRYTGDTSSAELEEAARKAAELADAQARAELEAAQRAAEQYEASAQPKPEPKKPKKPKRPKKPEPTPPAPAPAPGPRVVVTPPDDHTSPETPVSPPPVVTPAARDPLTLPEGYDPEAARREVRALVAHLRRAGRSGYDRRWLERWQRYAGIEPDRIYGGATRGALLYYGGIDPPVPFFPPLNTIPYVPPEAR